MTAVLCFTACSPSNSADSSADTSLQAESAPAENTPTTAPAQESTTAPIGQEENTPSEPAPEEQKKSAANTPDLSVLSDILQDLEQRINSLSPSGSDQEQKEQYLALKNEIDALDNELEYAEDTFESQYHNGSMEMAQYQELELEIDALEDRLDHCEDQLEFIFGIDD